MTCQACGGKHSCMPWCLKVAREELIDKMLNAGTSTAAATANVPTTLTKATIDKTVAELMAFDKAYPRQSNPLDLLRRPSTIFGMEVHVLPEWPKIQIREHVVCSDKVRAEMNAWLLEMFGTESDIPRGTAYMIRRRYLMHPADARSMVKMIGGLA